MLLFKYMNSIQITNFPKYIFLLLVLAIVNSTFAENVPPDSSNYLKNPNYKIQTELYDIYKTRQTNIIMFGDSHTQGVEWPELLGRNDVVGRGIVSDVTEGMLARMNYIYKLKPKYVFIMAGINDIYNWVPTNDIFNNIVKMVDNLRARGITPVIQSVLFAGKNWGKTWIEENSPELKPEEVNRGRNKEVRELNRLLRNYCKANNLTYVELISKMDTRDGFLKGDLSRDDLHLNAKGYKIWGDEIIKTLKSLGM